MAKETATIFHNGTIILADRVLEGGAILVREGVIEAIEISDRLRGVQGTWIDANGGLIGPGYVDLHVHGGAGADFMDGSEDAVIRVCSAHANHGTTTIFPTTTTGSREQVLAMLKACAKVRDRREPESGARIGGVHFYGPYFAEEKAGCHLRAGCRYPDPDEYERALGLGIVRIATCAAELPGAIEFYAAARKRGCLITCGHSNASWNEMKRAFDAGMRHVDHFWCAMSSVPSIRARFGTPTQGSMEQFVLMEREMSTEVIADGCHLAEELLEFAVRMKGVDRICLVTDANRAMDMPPGDYRFGPITDGEWFSSDGWVGRQDSGGLASSVRGMDWMVKQMARATSAGTIGAVRMGSLTPAERVGMAGRIGSLEAGKEADILVMDCELNVQRVFMEGREWRINSDA